MSLLFFLPFGVGSLYSIRKEMKQPLGWGLPASFLTTTSTIGMFKSLHEEIPMTSTSVKKIPGMFLGSVIVNGAFFCLGHLFTKMAYPVFQQSTNGTVSVPGKNITIHYGKSD
jgi:hypothetical protein